MTGERWRAASSRPCRGPRPRRPRPGGPGSPHLRRVPGPPVPCRRSAASSTSRGEGCAWGVSPSSTTTRDPSQPRAPLGPGPVRGEIGGCARPRDLSRLRRPRRAWQASRPRRPRRHRRRRRARSLGAGGPGRAAADQPGATTAASGPSRSRSGAARCRRRTRSGTAGTVRGLLTDFRPEIVQIEEEPWSNGAAAIARAARRLGIPYVLLTRESLPVSRSTLAGAPPEPRARRRARASSRSTSSPAGWRSRASRPCPTARIPQIGTPLPLAVDRAAPHRARHRVRRPADSARRDSTCCSAPRSS